MIPKECKRLAEVDFPIAVVSKHSAREKSIRHGHPSTLHLWWARRPLAACRSMLMALLLPDPVDSLCPSNFKVTARELLPELVGTVKKDDLALRKALLKFIGDFANWDNSAHPVYLKVARGLVKAAHPEETPLVVDPFAGGGSIPLEALRVGCDAFASDLNPVACLILKVMLEDIPRQGPVLADELRKVGKEFKEKAEKELGAFYPTDPDGAKPIAYLWARTVKCESPNCGAEIPLMRSFWLCKKGGRKRALKHEVHQVKGKPPVVEFTIFEPRNDSVIPDGTVTRAKATCLCCGVVLPPDRVRKQLAAQKGGADAIFDSKGNRVGGARMTAVVTLKLNQQGRHYRLPMETDYRAVWKAQKKLEDILDKWERNGSKGLCPIPDEPTPAGGGSGAGRAFSVQRYGMMHFGDLFTARQKTLMRFMTSLGEGGSAKTNSFGPVISRCADYWSSGVVWAQEGEFVAHTFGRQALPIIWDFAEAVPFADASGNFDGALDWVCRVIVSLPKMDAQAQVQCADAMEHPLPTESAHVYFTDPPYYDAIPYSDLSDYFLTWLKRAFPAMSLLQDRYDVTNVLSHKLREAVQDETRVFEGKPKDREFFEKAMARAFAEGRRILREEGIGSVVFAHKTTEGWEALLGGLVRAGLTITGSWPIATERPGRLRSQESAALATSVHLVCRPRIDDVVGDWQSVYTELPVRVAEWMERLQSEHIRGADLVFACIGPALEIYSRYSKVLDSQDREVPLGGDPEATDPHKRGYLAYVWEAVGRAALEQVLGSGESKARNGMAGVLEEDSRLTALFLWTLQSSNGVGVSNGTDEADEDAEQEDDEDDTTIGKSRSKGFALPYDVVRRFAQPLGIHLDNWEKRIIDTDKGVVTLLSVKERATLLFGEEGANAVAAELERDPAKAMQINLFGESIQTAAPTIRGRGRGGRSASNVSDDELQSRREATTLDRVHAAMLLQKSGRTNALRALLAAEQQRGSDFVRLANALSALYPKDSEEKRLVDAMLLAVPR